MNIETSNPTSPVHTPHAPHPERERPSLHINLPQSAQSTPAQGFQSPKMTSPKRMFNLPLPPALTPLSKEPTREELINAVAERDALIKYKDSLLALSSMAALPQTSVPSIDFKSLRSEEKDHLIKVLMKLCHSLPGDKLPQQIFPVSTGEYKFLEGGTYTGEMVMGKPHGEGSMRGGKGGVYSGQWREGKKDGLGKFTWQSGAEYNGEWKEGKRSGQGVYKAPTGIEYSGGYLEDKKDGWGMVTMQNGQRQLAMHKDGMMEGMCVEIDPDESTVWLKGYSKDKLHGCWRRLELAEKKNYFQGVLQK